MMYKNQKYDLDNAMEMRNKVVGDAVLCMSLAKVMESMVAKGHVHEVDINKKTENQAKMTKLSMEWKRL
ncbi:hypothetical protein Tco_1490614 [Tanacetum coccineum]